MLNVQALACVRGDRLLFKNVNFALKAGELLYARGENGSGKSSLLRILSGLLQPEQGLVTWLDEDILQEADAYRASLLYIGHLNALKDDLSAIENLRVAASLAGHRHDEATLLAALQAVGLAPFADVQIRKLSQGQKRRISLARMWLSKAKLWLLDEPFAALDNASIAVVANRIGEHLATGGMVVLTTHQDVDIQAASFHEVRLSA